MRRLTLFLVVINAGSHAVDWDGTNYEGQLVSSGVYFYRFEAAGKMITKKMTLLR